MAESALAVTGPSVDSDLYNLYSYSMAAHNMSNSYTTMRKMKILRPNNFQEWTQKRVKIDLG